MRFVSYMFINRMERDGKLYDQRFVLTMVGARRGGDLPSLPEELSALDKELEPVELIPAIKTYVLGKGDYWALDSGFYSSDANGYSDADKRIQAKALSLGEHFAASAHELDDLGSELFSNDWMPYGAAFGKGLAKGAHDARAGWRKLLEYLAKQAETRINFAVFVGFIEQTNCVDNGLAQELLEQCARHPQLRRELVGLHPQHRFTEADLSRCEALLDDPAIRLEMFGPVMWRDDYAHLPSRRVLDLAHRLLTSPNGADIVLDALSMKLHDKDDAADTLGFDLRQVGLKAAIQRFRRDRTDSGGRIDHAMTIVVGAALRFDGNEPEKLEWLDTIFTVIDESYGYVLAFEKAIQTTAAFMTRLFLDRVFDGTQEQLHRRLLFINHGSQEEPLLAQIDIEVLIDWCSARNDSKVWESVASAIDVWSNEGDEVAVKISGPAIRLLEASNNPDAVLNAYAELVSPSVWGGSLANAMQPRAAAIGLLVNHENSAIGEAASAIYRKLATRIESEKLREQTEDEGREQRFE